MSQIEVRRSRRRTKTVSAYYENGRTVVAIPDRFTMAEEEEWVATMVERLQRGQRRRRPSDTGLVARAAHLSDRYLEGRARAQSVAWVDNQTTRWGSCTPSTGTIRISTNVKGMPQWVLDYVLLHELTHLLVPGHGPEFWRLVERYPHTMRARGFLDGVSFAQRGAGESPAGEGIGDAVDETDVDDGALA